MTRPVKRPSVEGSLQNLLRRVRALEALTVPQGGSGYLPIDFLVPSISSGGGSYLNYWSRIGNGWDASFWEFDPDFDGYVTGMVFIPDDVVIEASPVQIHFETFVPTNTGVVTWIAHARGFAEGENVDGVLLAASAQNITVDANTMGRQRVTFTCPATVETGDIVIVSLQRDANSGNDTCTDPARLLSATLQVT